MLYPPTFLTTFSQHFEVSDVISNHLLHIRMFLYAFECFCSSLYDLHEKNQIQSLSKVEATATAVPSTAAGKQKYKWNDQTVEKLIDLYEERPCLWDISDRSYSIRDVKEKALSEIKDELDIELKIIQAKWKSLRAQYGSELAKENKTKCGQSADELYESSWAFMQKMRFVDRVRKTAKSTSTLKLTDTSTVDEESDKEDDKMDDSMVSDSNTPSLPKQIKKKRVNINEEKQKLIEKYIDVLDKPKSPKRLLIEDPFALYVSHQLKGLDKTRRLIVEKK